MVLLLYENENGSAGDQVASPISRTPSNPRICTTLERVPVHTSVLRNATRRTSLLIARCNNAYTANATRIGMASV